MGKVTVVGLGKVGLPLALAITKGGHDVIGVDISSDVVSKLSLGEIPSTISEPGLQELLDNGLNQNRFTTSTNLGESVRDCDTIVVIVPLKLDGHGNPNFDALDSVTQVISEFASPKTLVIYETTLPIGTTRQRFVPILARGMKVDESLILATFSPERIFSGAYLKTLATIPKVIGGVNEESSNRAANFYRSFIEKLDGCTNGSSLIEVVSNSETAEFIKIAETTYRDVNIALANTFAIHAVENNLDFSEIRRACNANDFSHIHKPSIWVGGHCIPVYPRLYLSTDPEANLIQKAREVNESMPDYFISKILAQFSDITEKTILIKGITYRGDVKELYMSGAFILQEKLGKLGAKVVVEDPMYSDAELQSLGFTPFEKHSMHVQIVIFQSDHASYKDFTPEQMPEVDLFIDGRSFVRGLRFNEPGVFSLGNASDAYAPNVSSVI